MEVFSKRRENENERIIDWNLGNQCNYDCWYCDTIFKSGKNKFQAYDMIINFIDMVFDNHFPSNKILKFSFVGGEVTLHPYIIDICKYCNEEGAKVKIMSNGSKSTKFWYDISPYIDELILTYHIDYNSLNHFISIISTYLNQNINGKINVIIPFQPQKFNYCKKAYKKLKNYEKKYERLYVDKQILFKDHVYRKKILDYTQKQLDYLKNNEEVIERYNDQVHKDHKNYEKGLNHNKEIVYKNNSFKGWYCMAGVDQMVVDQKGYIWRGWCGVGGYIGTIYDKDISFPKEEIKCTKLYCNNFLDLQAKKYKL